MKLAAPLKSEPQRGFTPEDEPAAPRRISPVPRDPTSEDGSGFGARLAEIERTHSWAGPDPRSRVFVIGSQPVELLPYAEERLHVRVKCLTTSPHTVAIGPAGVTFPLADTNAGDVQENGGEVLAVGEVADLWRAEAPVRLFAVAAEGTTALVSVLEFTRALRRT